jgi:hypothetical protein
VVSVAQNRLASPKTPLPSLASPNRFPAEFTPDLHMGKNFDRSGALGHHPGRPWQGRGCQAAGNEAGALRTAFGNELSRRRHRARTRRKRMARAVHPRQRSRPASAGSRAANSPSRSPSSTSTTCSGVGADRKNLCSRRAFGSNDVAMVPMARGQHFQHDLTKITSDQSRPNRTLGNRECSG